MVNVPSARLLAWRAWHRTVVPAARVGTHLTALRFAFERAFVVLRAQLAAEVSTEEAPLAGMADVLDSLDLDVFVCLLVGGLLVAVVLLRRFRGDVEHLALMALGLAGTTAASHRPAADRTTGIPTRILRAHHRCLMLAAWEALCNHDGAEDGGQVVALVAIIASPALSVDAS